MGDNGDYENCFWGERDEFCGGVFAAENFQSDPPFQTANQSFNHQESGSNNIRLSADSDHQEGERGDGDSRPSLPMPLGLTLTKTSSFMNLLQRTYDNATKINELEAPPPLPDQKLKASNFPAMYIRIGTWERISRYEGDLTAKMYYAKRKLVWEVLEGPLKNKIEIQWSDITAIRALTPENQPGLLEIEMNQPPLFYREINPQPRKHTIWQQSSDFTGGQAPTWRRHCVSFPPGVLDKHYEKLLQCDQRLLKLTENPFPAQETPFFDTSMFGVSQLSRIFNGCGSSQSPYNAYLTTTPPDPPSQTMPGNNTLWNPLSQASDPTMAAGSNAWSTSSALNPALMAGIDAWSSAPNPTIAAGSNPWSASASNPALMAGINDAWLSAPNPTMAAASNAWSSAPNPTMPGTSNNSWSSLQQPPIQAMDYSYTNSNQFVAGPWGEVSYEASVGGIDQQQFLGESSHMDMVSYAHTNSNDQTNYYNIVEAAPYSQPQQVDWPVQPQQVEWVQPPPDQQIHHNLDALLMQQQQHTNNVSLPPYCFQADHNPTNGGFF